MEENKLKKEKPKEEPKEEPKTKRDYSRLIGKFKSKSKPLSPSKQIKKRESQLRGALTAMGVIQGKQTYSGAGRPRGTYKYGMPIHVYKQMMRENKSRYQQYQQQRQQELSTQGFTPEQVQQLQQQQTMEELQQPSVPEAIRQLQQRQQRIDILKQAQQGQQTPIYGSGYAQDLPYKNPSDDDLEFTKWRAEKTIHPNTQRLLNEVRRIQLLGKRSNIEQARRNRERRMLARQMDLMKAHENLTNVNMNFTGVPEDNILFAPNSFKEIPENNILRPNRFSVLQTREGGNNLNFWT